MMGLESTSNLFRSSDTDANGAEFSGTMVVKAYPLGMIRANGNLNGEDEVDSRYVPSLGLEFDSADEARDFYSSYATHMGFKIRTGQLYRSRTDGSVSSRRFVCSKEGVQLNSRTGCSAFIRVQKHDSGKWVIDQIQKEHNHELGILGEDCPSVQNQKTTMARKSLVSMSKKSKVKSHEQVVDGRPNSSGVINVKRLKIGGNEGESKTEPYAGLVFISADEAYQCYQIYAESAGFRVRIGQLFRSKFDGSITSRRFVCSREGFQHPSRVGCGAFMRIKRQDSGRWVVDRLQKDHNNHDILAELNTGKKSLNAPKNILEDESDGLDSMELPEIQSNSVMGSTRPNNIGSDWYHALFEYFQTKQAKDTGFFYSVDLHSGNCRSIFWADGRSRFSGSQFGDTIVFDTSYRKSEYLIPFATFVGVNNHRQPVLLGCALVSDESRQSFSWIFQTWLRAMSGCHPKSIIADQDMSIQQAIAQVFPRTRHRFSLWQIRAKERELLRQMCNEFRYEYDRCIYQSQTNAEFNTTWNGLINKYALKENIWLKEMYERRESWVPLYLRGTFFAGIPMNESIESFFGTLVNAQTPLEEFIYQYEQALEQRRDEERKEDFNCFNLQAFLQTKEPVEEQCRRLYTLAVFKIFQNELLQSYSYLGIKAYEEGAISRYTVRRCGSENENNAVTFNASNLNISCSCQVFEFEGVLCRHVLRVFSLLDIREIPSRYILSRWTRSAEYGVVHDAHSGVSPQELRTLMLWSLREAACKYIESGTSSLEKYKLAAEILQEGGKKLSW